MRQKSSCLKLRPEEPQRESWGGSQGSLTCSYCDKKVAGDAVKKKFDDKDYFFCCTTCQGEFEKKYTKLSAKAK
jgi:YHS domain-containing protein